MPVMFQAGIAVERAARDIDRTMVPFRSTAGGVIVDAGIAPKLRLISQEPEPSPNPGRFNIYAAFAAPDKRLTRARRDANPARAGQARRHPKALAQ